MRKGNSEDVAFMVSYQANEDISKDLKTIKKITDLLGAKNLKWFYTAIDSETKKRIFFIRTLPQSNPKLERKLRESVKQEIKVIIRGS